jgi:hypothetical protein
LFPARSNGFVIDHDDERPSSPDDVRAVRWSEVQASAGSHANSRALERRNGPNLAVDAQDDLGSVEVEDRLASAIGDREVDSDRRNVSPKR